MRTNKVFRALTLAVGVSAAACGGDQDANPEATPAQAARPAEAPSAPAAMDTAPAGVVDSVFPMDAMLARFREGLTEPTRLEHGADSRDALVQRIVGTLEASDTIGFEALAVDRAEFAWLYFPTTAVSRPPYELPPGLAWFRIQEGNRKGVFRALREFGGRTLTLRGYRCPEQPQIEGKNRVWVGCTVQLGREPSEVVSLRLFESILERDGRFAILSFANDF